MKHILITIAAVVLTGCIVVSKTELLKDEKGNPIILPIESVAGTAAKPETSSAIAPDISIHDAAGEGDIEAVKQHLVAGADVNAKDHLGLTPLHYAAIEAHNEIIELLIAKGADVNAKEIGGVTPLDWGIFWKHSEIVNLLRKHGGKTGEELKAEEK